MKNFGFTLPEALFFLLITGIVAMLMMPIVKVANEKQMLHGKWKKNYYEISNAYNLAKDAVQKRTSSPVVFSDDIVDEMKSRLNVTQNCGDIEYVCGTNPKVAIGEGEKNIYKTLSGGHLDVKDLYRNQLLLTNGANIYEGDNQAFISTLWIDINGYVKGPNILGKDLFGVVITPKNILPMGLNGTSLSQGEKDCSKNDKYVPIVNSGRASDYAGASCSTTKLYGK